MQVLLEHGRLRTDQLLSLVAALRKGDKRKLDGAARTCLANLVQSRYVQRARGCEAQRLQRPPPANVKVQPFSFLASPHATCRPKLPDHACWATASCCCAPFVWAWTLLPPMPCIKCNCVCPWSWLPL